jgi:excisionase family DNA binding protein
MIWAIHGPSMFAHCSRGTASWDCGLKNRAEAQHLRNEVRATMMVAVVAVIIMSSVLEPSLISDLDEAQITELQHLLTKGPAALGDATGRHRVALPDKPYQVLLKIIQDLANGRAVFLVSAAQEMTTQEAANFLGCSRQFLVRLLDEGKIPFHRVGSHRRVYLQDLITFRKERDRRRHEAIQEMARDAVKDGVYDDF